MLTLASFVNVKTLDEASELKRFTKFRWN